MAIVGMLNNPLLCIKEQRSLMQIKKENTRQKILAIARDEFIMNGFRDTSMRTIAYKSGITLSNIYTYFHNKDEIFKAVLSGVFAAIDQLMEEHNNAESIDLYIMNAHDYVKSQIDFFVNLVTNYKEDFNLLLFKASGSSLENFRDQFIDRHSAIGNEYFLKVKNKYPTVNIEVSSFFIHTMSSWSISVIAELVSHDLSREEIEQFMSEYLAFGTAGWRKIMNLQ